MLTGIQESDLGTYRCDVTNDVGTGSANITIGLGGIYIYLYECIRFGGEVDSTCSNNYLCRRFTLSCQNLYCDTQHTNYYTCIRMHGASINTLRFMLSVCDGCGRGRNEFAGRVQNYHVRSSCHKNGYNLSRDSKSIDIRVKGLETDNSPCCNGS